jgi:hypothetical protein
VSDSVRNISWRDWPAQRQRGRAVLAGVVIVAASVSVAVVEPWLAAIGSVAMLASVSEVLLPTRYTLSEKGLFIDNVLRKRRHPWRHFQGYRALGGRVALLGAGPSRLIRRRRSAVLRCPANTVAVVAVLAHRLDASSGGGAQN